MMMGKDLVNLKKK